MADVATAAGPAAADVGTGPTGRWRRHVPALARLYWLWPALLTVAIGVRGIGVPALWADELATWGAVRLGWRPLFALLRHVDLVVAPYYLPMKVWTGLAGTSTVALRLPSVLAMGVTAALLAVLGARLFAGTDPDRSRWIGLVAGVLFAIVPATSRYGQEARPYALELLCVVLATLLVERLLRRPSWLGALGYGLSIVLVGAFHLVGLLLLVAHGVALCYAGYAGPAEQRVAARRALRRWAVAAGLALLVLLPLAWFGRRQSGQVSWIPPVTWRTLLSAPDTIFLAGTTAGSVLVLALLGLRRTVPAVLLAAWAVLPPLALYLIAELTPLFWARYLTFTLAGWVLLAAFTVGRLPRSAGIALVAVLALLAWPAQHQLRVTDGHLHATATAAGIIAANQQPGDGIVYALGEQPEPWEARDLVARYVPAARTPRDIFAVTAQRTDGRLTATECADLAECLARADPPRLWVIRFGTTGDPLARLGRPKEALLRARYHLISLWPVRGLTVALLARD